MARTSEERGSLLPSQQEAGEESGVKAQVEALAASAEAATPTPLAVAPANTHAQEETPAESPGAGPTEVQADPEPFTPEQIFEDAHRGLERLFRQFQEALIGLELELAGAFLEAYHSQLAGHMAAEEAGLLAAYSQLVAHPPRGGAPSLFFDEHRKLEDILDELNGRLHHALGNDDRDEVRSIVLDLLERSFTFSGVTEHHHQREEKLLIPALRGVLEPEILASMIQAVAEPA